MNNTETFDLTFLGTGASDFSNRLKTDCKDRFDRDARRSSAVLINSGYLIDAGVFVLDSLRIAKREPNQITDIFVTHFHNDHFLRENVEKIAKDKPRALRIWVRDSAEVDPIENVTVIKMKPFERYAVSNGLFVTGLPVNHDETTFPQHLLLEKDHKKVFYGCDGAWFLNATYRFLRDQELSMMILDCTVGDYAGDYRMAEHNSIPMVRLMLPFLKKIRTINDQTLIFLSNIAPSLHKPHDEIEEIAKGFGATVAFDGQRVVL